LLFGCTERASQPGRICRNVIDVDETPIKITIADTLVTAQGRQRNRTRPRRATARDLAARLPLTLTFKDFNHVEKVATLPRRLSTDDVPAGADPDIGGIGYYAPSGNLVFYYGDVGYWDGIVRIGRFDTTMELIEHQAAVDLYTATGELEVGVPQGTAAWRDARRSTGRVHNYLEPPDAPEQSDWTSRSAPAATAVTSSCTAPAPDAAPTTPTSPRLARETASASLEPSHALITPAVMTLPWHHHAQNHTEKGQDE
jgi:hypothetical protein